ncbi:MAG: FAD/NAD(P)-binding protein [Pseudomonas sp.]|uniref:FAD/NAD(P)-binding protein n=1 Tax=Pseudomonas sp. TaxID=306 RepID=UPI002734DB02|nr:FAD/NAD(P)-binding protein [Pseudomonas sp.]MDP3845582.1 FAD/NAD(P)-binding protein [Pseudomonas sp.]
MLELTPRKLRLLDYYDDGEDARHFSFAIESPWVSDLQTIAGQFFMLALPGFGEAPFTYVSQPDAQGRFNALIRRTGALSNALFELPAGAVLGYRGPFGKGWPLFFSTHQVLVVAGGCGLAPLAGLLDEAAEHHLPVHLRVIYGARRQATQVLGRERERWKQTMSFSETFDQAGAGQQQGSPLVHLEQLFAKQMPDAVLCCGPQALMQATADSCLNLGIPANKIWLSMERRMHCGVGLCGHCYIGASYACVDGPVYRYDQLQAVQAGCLTLPQGQG